MYNSEIKERFVRSYTDKISVRTFCRRFFDVAQKFEEQWNADLCTRTPEEIQPLVNDASGLTTQSRDHTLSLIRTYVRWCIGQNNIPNVCEALLNINGGTSSKFKSHTVTSPVHLQKYLNDVFSPEEDKTVDIVFRTYLWMAYAGITQKDVLNIRTKNIDLSEMVVRYNDKLYPIYREGMKAIRLCVELDHFQTLRSNTGKFVIINRADGDLIMRGKTTFSNKTLQERISRKQKEANDNGATDLNLSFFKVWISGLFYRVYMDELAGIQPDFSQFMMDIDSAKKTKGKPTEIRRRAKLYYEDYLSWKDSLSR